MVLEGKTRLAKQTAAAVTILIFVFLLRGSSSCHKDLRLVTTRGGSMEGVFRESDEVKVDYAYYECHEPKRGDIVIVNVGRKETELMKIISAVPGDLWDMQQQDDGVYRIVVNGGPLYTKTNGMYQIPAERAVMLQKYAKGYNQTIPPETILVLGNDPGGSYDSSVFGLISTKSLRGRVITRSKF